MRPLTLVLPNPIRVKKVVLPRRRHSFAQLAPAIFNIMVCLRLLCIFLLIQHYAIPVTALLGQFVLAPLLLFTATLVWFYAAIGVFFRDVGQMIGVVVLSVPLFLNPVFYPVSSTQSLALKLIYMNPLTFPIEELRTVLILGNQPHWLHLLVYFSAVIVMAVSGLLLFQKFRTALADVL